MSEYYYSLNEEEYHDIDYIAQELKDDKSILTVFVGEAIQPTHKQFIVSVDICEEMQNRAYDEFDEYAEGYLVSVSKEQKEELEIKKKQLKIKEYSDQLGGGKIKVSHLRKSVK